MYLHRWCQQASPWAIGSQGTFSPIINIIISTSYSTACTKTLKMADINSSFKQKRKKLQMQNPWRSKQPLCNQLSFQKGIKDPKQNHKSKDMFVTEREWKKIVSKHVQKESILFCCMSNTQKCVYLTQKKWCKKNI